MACTGHAAHGGNGHGHGHADLEAPLLGHDNHGNSHDGHSHDDHGDDHGHSHDDHGDDNGNGHGCGHGHGHEDHDDHHDEGMEDQDRLKMAVYCALFFMFVEIGGGVFSNSLAIITDAAHMLSDVGGFIVSLVTLQLSMRGATQEYTYGFKQAEVLGALLSIAIVWALTAILLWEAFPRFANPEEIDAPVMCIISVIGFLVNLVLMKVLGHGHSHDGGHGHSHGGGDDSVAVQAALAHVIGDIVQSLGVCLASVLIWFKPFDIGTAANGVSKWNYADPMCTVLFSVLVLFTTKSTFVRTIDTLMAKSPAKIDQSMLEKSLTSIPHVDSVHDLHVWSLGSKDILCTAHVMVESAKYATSALTAAIKVAQKAGIGHSTFQIEIVGEFDPSIESFGTLCENKSSKSLPVAKTGCCDGHDHGGHDSHANDGHEHGGHSGHAGHGGHAH